MYLACRTESKATNAINQILKDHSDIVGLNERLAWLPLDLSSVVESEQAAKDFLAIESRLDILGGSFCVASGSDAIIPRADRLVGNLSVLVNNAARGIVPYALSEEGIELSVATKYVNTAHHTSMLPFTFAQSSRPLRTYEHATTSTDDHLTDARHGRSYC